MLQLREEGMDRTIRELMAFDKDVLNILQREVRAAANIMADDVRGNFQGIGRALSNWGPWASGRLDFEGSKAAGGIKARTNTRAKSGSQVKTLRASVVNTSAPAAVFMLAGAKSSEGAFIQNLQAKYAWPYPRFMTTAYRTHIEEVRDKIDEACDRAAAAVQR